MQTIEKTISNLIKTQFPSYYNEEGPILVAFVTEYYKWLESTNQALYFSRKFYDLKDIDTTLDSFLVYFKEKYLKNIQFTTTTNTRQLIKHALDIYRSKGTERSIDLLFKLVFGTGVEVYYPSNDIFRLSDGRWKRPTYLEVAPNEKTFRFSNKQITGLTSGATAFVEQVIRKNIQGKIIDVLYISSVTGTFHTNEIIVTEDDFDLNNERIKIVGSLSSVVFPSSGSGSNYSIGDIVDVFGHRGRQGQIRVTGIDSLSGVIDFSLLNGGYAYTANAKVIVSDKVLKLINVISNSSSNEYFTFNEVVRQPKAKINYENLTGNTRFYIGDQIFTYHTNNALKATGLVIGSNPVSNTSGDITVMITSGSNLNESRFYGLGNVVSANISSNGYLDLTTTAKVTAVSSNVELIVTNINGTFEPNELIYVSNIENNIIGGQVYTYTRSGLQGTLELINSKIAITPNTIIIGSNSLANAIVSSVNILMGVHDISNNSFFTSANGNFLIGNNGSNSIIKTISQGVGASFQISNNLLYSETISLNDDLINNYLTVNLNSTYGFPQFPSANLSTILDNAFNYRSYVIGKIKSLPQINRGNGYNIAPFVVIYEPMTAPFEKKDLILTINDATGNFTVGEYVTQGNFARGIIKFANTSKIFVERLNFNDNDTFKETTNTSTMLVGFNSGAQANIIFVETNYSSNTLGFNAIIRSETSVSNGAIISAEVIDSGFGYVNDELLTFGSNTNISTAIAKVETMGKSRGFYQIKGGFLSDQKKIFDGDYYQEYSYEIRSSVTLDKYKEMLRKILHVAGTKHFAKFVYRSDLNNEMDIQSNVNITISE